LNLEDILHTNGAENIPGASQFHWLIKCSDVTPPILPPVPTTLAELVTITDPFLLGIGKKFSKIYSTLDSGGFDYVLQGENDSKTFLSFFEFSYPGNEAQADGLITFLKHVPHYFIPVLGNGQRRLMGYVDKPCVLKKADGTSGKKGTDYKGIRLRVESTLWCPAPILDNGVVVSGDIYIPPDED
jgi:hypothetical protein